MGTKFKNPSNDYVEEASSLAWLWALLFGPLYFGIKGVWPHAFGSLILALLTFGISHFVYCGFANSIIRKSYLRKGWIEMDDDIEFTSNVKKDVFQVPRDSVDKQQTFLIIAFIIVLIFSASFGLLVWKPYINNKGSAPEQKIYYLDKQTDGVKACVKTIGEGIYKDKPLQWKLKNCNAKYY